MEKILGKETIKQILKSSKRFYSILGPNQELVSAVLTFLKDRRYINEEKQNNLDLNEEEYQEVIRTIIKTRPHLIREFKGGKWYENITANQKAVDDTITQALVELYERCFLNIKSLKEFYNKLPREEKKKYEY